MFNHEKVQKIAKESETAKNLFDFLSKRNRFRRETNLDKFQQILMNKGYSVVEDDFFKVFRSLQDQGIGKIIIGRNGNPNRFKWHFNLKGVAKAANGKKIDEQDLSMETPATKALDPNAPKRKRGRPRKNEVVSSGMMEVTLRIPAEIWNQILSIKKSA